MKRKQPLLLIISLLVLPGSSLVPGSTEGRQSPTVGSNCRRAFLASVLTASTVCGIAPPRSARALPSFPWSSKDDEGSAFKYDDFKSLLRANQLAQVEFGSDGHSLKCVDKTGKTLTLKEPPNDTGLLKELYLGKVDVTLEEFKFERKMNTAAWFKDLVGAGDDLTDEDLYEYRGYKTYRRSIPEKAYLPSSLIMLR